MKSIREIKKIVDILKSYIKEGHGKIYLVYSVFILFMYFPLISEHFAITDDYSAIGFALDHSKGLLDWDIRNGRPVYGIFQYLMQPFMMSVPKLSWLRFFTIISTIVLCCFIYKFILLKVKISSQYFISYLPLFIVLLPPIVVYNAWSVCFVYVLSILLSGIAYYYIYNDNRETTIRRFVAGVIILICAFLIYQPTAMMFLYFVFLNTCIDSRKIKLSALISSAIALLLAMLASLFAIKFLPRLLYGGVIERSNFSNDLLSKIHWFFHGPLKIAIYNYNITPNIIYTIISVLLLLCGFFFLSKERQGVLKVLLTLILMVGVMVPTLLAKENWTAARSSVGLYFIIITIILFGLVNVYQKFLLKYDIRFLLGGMLLVIGIYTQYYIYNGIIRQQQSEFQALTQEIASVVPQQYTGKIRFDLTNPLERAFTKFHFSDEIGQTSVQIPWAIKGIAQSIKQLKGLSYRIDDSNLVLQLNENCKTNCIIINCGDVLRKAAHYK